MLMSGFVADVRFAARTLWTSRLFTLVAVACLALALAANVTVFSVFDAIFLRPLPFPDGERLVSISGMHPETRRRVPLSVDDLGELAPALRAFTSLAAYSGRTVTLNDGGDPERVSAQLVTPGLFPLLGVSPQRGAGFAPDHQRQGAGGVALISDSLWRRRYQADPAVLGRAVRIDDATHTIVGVMPPKFRFPSMSEVWMPMPVAAVRGTPARGVSILGRLSPDAELTRANAELASLTLPESGSRPARIAVGRPFGGIRVGSEERIIIGSLMGATTVLLIIACVNLANLMLARGAGRRREIAVRASLGASRMRLMVQLLTEAVLLALVAAVVALPLAAYGIHWVHEAVPPTDPLGPYYVDWSLDLRTFAYAVAVALLTGILFGLMPAVDAGGRNLLAPLREGSGAASSRRQRRIHDALIVTQIALGLVLLAGASLFVRTYAGLRAVELGYDASRLMTMRFYLAGAAYETADARARAVDEITRRLAALPRAHAATVTDLVPLDDQGGSDTDAEIEGRTSGEGSQPTLHFAGVAGRWPETFDVRLLAGRSFYDHELQSATALALVNEKLAKTFWPGEDPIGRRFRFAGDEPGPWLTVIGVVPNIRTVKLDESHATPPTAYVPHHFLSTRNYGIVVRTIDAPATVTADVRAVVRAVDPSVALFDVYPMEQIRWLSYWMYVMWGTMFGVLGLLALFVAAVGVYGVVFYTVARRAREIGICVALGARRGQVVAPMLRHVGLLALLGLAIGIPAAVAITPVVRSLLIGVSPHDPAGFAAVSLLLSAVALIATWLPAWNASAIDPASTLRRE